ncbi:MAG TPA: hypothetical protein VK835_12390 [Bacteroidia bacterium]|jgi:hypothetical protein|nr:hypothetical protein [Bacteroidia bacterium]
MKKLLFFLLLSYTTLAQNNAVQLSNFIVIDSIKPDTACINSTVKVYIHFIYTGFSPTDQINVVDSVSPSSTNVLVIPATYQKWVDSNYVLSFVNYNGNLVNGKNSFRMNNQSNSMNFQQNNCIQGIEHYNSQENLLSTQYYNLLGQPVKEPDGVTVEVKTYVGGQREVRKIVTSK